MGTLKVDTIQDSGGNTILSSDGSGGFSNSLPAGKTSSYRNIIINGDMSIAQRGTSATGKTTTAYYTIDRYQTLIENIGTWSISQSTDVPSGQGFGYSQKINCTTADASLAAGDRMFYRQSFEGQNLQHLKKGTSNAESLTLSFWVKSNKTGTYIVEFWDHDNSRHINKSYTVSSASTWEKKTITIDGDTTGAFTNDNNLSFHVAWWLGAGSDNSSGTLQTSWGPQTIANRAVGQVNLADSTSNEWYITGVQLEVGTTASDFEFLPYDVNLQRCYRYCQVLCSESNAGALTGGFRNSGSFQCGLTFPVPMRSSPSVTLKGLRLHDLNDGDNLDVSSVSIVNATGTKGIWLSGNNGGTGTTAGVCVLYGYNASPTSGVLSYGVLCESEL